jgi:glycosyltransferase involved in cell wall biosynthesis
VKIVRHGLLKINVNEHEVDDFYLKNKEENKIIFSLLGSLEHYKGINLIYETWNKNKLINSNTNIKLIIAGRGNIKVVEKFKKFKNVDVINKYLSNEEFLGFMKVSDVILMPYEKISQSGVLLTAINERKLSIVSNVGGLTEPFALAKIGWVMSEYTQQELRDIIDEASKLQKKKTYINEHNYNKLSEYYHWKKISILTNQIYNGI